MAERTEPIHIVGPQSIQDYVLSNKRFLRTDFGYPLEFTELSGEGGVVYDGPEYVIEAALLQHRLPTYGFALAEKDRPGRFKLEQARALGVPMGPLFGQLQAGRSVTLADGRVITPEQVLGEPRPGLRFAYVADTRPCRNGRLLARQADLLVHEGTFAGDLASEARKKKHSTVVEAAEVARDAGAKQLVLTHFSPRYLDLEPLRREAAAIFPNVLAATDLMAIELGGQPGEAGDHGPS
jgi:ribonuclease Z